MRYLVLLLLLALPVRADQASDFRVWLTQWEGYTHVPVFRSREITVGVGHNLIDGPYPIKARYTDKEIDAFYRADYAVALRAAREGVFDFDYLPKRARYTVLSLIWTVGPTGFMRFRMFRAYMSLRDYRDAALELEHSKWAYQVGPRRRWEHVTTLESL